MQFEELQRKLIAWDNTRKKALETCTNEMERKVTSTVINIKKMELLDNYLIEACTDPNLLMAIEQFSELALKAVKELVGTYEKT